jgi:Uma2 family endonuclease
MGQSSTVPRVVRGEWTRMSYEDFLAWAPEGMRTEWRDGAGIVYMSNTDRHQAVIELVLSLLSSFVRVFGLGRVGFAPYGMELRPGGPHREPDVLFLRTAHLDRWDRTQVRGPADLAVEVLSVDTAQEDLRRKRDEYAVLGVPEYVIIDSRPGHQDFHYWWLNAAGEYEPVEPDEQGRYRSTVLPGFWLDPAWFRQDPLPNPLTLLRRISPEAWRRLVEEVEREG